MQESTFLCNLARKFTVPKASHYIAAYDLFLNRRRQEQLRLLEIGVAKGESLRMWREYFPNAAMFAIDIEPGCAEWAHKLTECYIEIFDQADTERMLQFVESNGGAFDIVIDDGGHHMEQQLNSFFTLWDTIKPGGLYAIEDTGTSYWTNYGGRPLENTGTTVAMLKSLIDSVHDKDLQPGWSIKYGGSPCAVDQWSRSRLVRNVASCHFYHGLAFVFKDG